MIPKAICTGVGWVWLARLSFQHVLEGGFINYFYELAGKGVKYCSGPQDLQRLSVVLVGRNKVL